MYSRQKNNTQKSPWILYSATRIPVPTYSIHKQYFWRIKWYIKWHKIAKKPTRVENPLKKWANTFYFRELNSLWVHKNDTHLWLVVIFWWEWWQIQSLAKTHTKIVEFEEETNMVERKMIKQFGFGASAIFNITASNPHVLMWWCVYEFHPFTAIVRE